MENFGTFPLGYLIVVSLVPFTLLLQELSCSCFNAFQISVEILAHFVLSKADSPVTKHLEEKDLLSVSR